MDKLKLSVKHAKFTVSTILNYKHVKSCIGIFRKMVNIFILSTFYSLSIVFSTAVNNTLFQYYFNIYPTSATLFN